MGDLLRDILKCEDTLEKMSGEIAAKLLSALQDRKQILMQNDHYLAAIYMDPRFNNMVKSQLTPEKNRAVSFLMKTNKRMKNLLEEHEQHCSRQHWSGKSR